jgi:hypothetical protein
MLDSFCVPIHVVIAENYPRRVKRGVSVGRFNTCILESKTDANLFIRQAVIFVAWDGRPLDFSRNRHGGELLTIFWIPKRSFPVLAESFSMRGFSIRKGV